MFSLALLKFIVVALTGLVLNTAAVAIVTEWLALSYWYVIVLMVCVVPVALFILNRQWAFRSGTINIYYQLVAALSTAFPGLFPFELLHLLSDKLSFSVDFFNTSLYICNCLD